jgi:glycosyltransferase involved in cell wall biosynthesis
MVTLRVVAEPAVGAAGAAARYTVELTRELVATAPAGCDVEAIVASHPEDELTAFREILPGLAKLTALPLRRKELTRAWQYGVPVPLGDGLIHAPTLLAPLFKHDRLNGGEQVVVSVHDAIAWTHPEFRTSDTAWRKAMVKRARKHADAVVVPTHAVAEQLQQHCDFGDRIRVISGAVAPMLQTPPDAEQRAAALYLPERYLLAIGSLKPSKGLTELISAMTFPDLADLPLLVVGPELWHEQSVAGVAMQAGLPEGRVRPLGRLDDADLAVVLERAAALVVPSLADGFGLPILEAFQFGTPVIHSDDPALVETADAAGETVPLEESGSTYPERLAATIADVMADSARAERLQIAGLDRARAFSWRDSAERVWRLHAEL